jgi:hypothetical protein
MPSEIVVNLGLNNLNMNFSRQILTQGLKARAFHDYGKYKKHLEKLEQTINNSSRKIQEAVNKMKGKIR